MYIIQVRTGSKRKVLITEAVTEDFKQLTKKRFSFDWLQYKNLLPVYKLQIQQEKDILGVIALEEWPEEKRIEIKLLASSVENVGRNKVFERIAGCLIAFACRLALKRYGALACVSLIPKTNLIDHYVKKYSMKYVGWQVYLEATPLIDIVNKYYES